MGPRSLRFHARFSVVYVTIGTFVTSAILALGALPQPPGSTPFTLIAGDPVSADNFGRAVSISSDTAVLGSPPKAGTQGRAATAVALRGSDASLERHGSTPWSTPATAASRRECAAQGLELSSVLLKHV